LERLLPEEESPRRLTRRLRGPVLQHADYADPVEI
jgi:hypothetical protein